MAAAAAGATMPPNDVALCAKALQRTRKRMGTRALPIFASSDTPSLPSLASVSETLLAGGYDSIKEFEAAVQAVASAWLSYAPHANGELVGELRIEIVTAIAQLMDERGPAGHTPRAESGTDGQPAANGGDNNADADDACAALTEALRRARLVVGRERPPPPSVARLVQQIADAVGVASGYTTPSSAARNLSAPSSPQQHKHARAKRRRRKSRGTTAAQARARRRARLRRSVQDDDAIDLSGSSPAQSEGEHERGRGGPAQPPPATDDDYDDCDSDAEPPLTTEARQELGRLISSALELRGEKIVEILKEFEDDALVVDPSDPNKFEIHVDKIGPRAARPIFVLLSAYRARQEYATRTASAPPPGEAGDVEAELDIVQPRTAPAEAADIRFDWHNSSDSSDIDSAPIKRQSDKAVRLEHDFLAHKRAVEAANAARHAAERAANAEQRTRAEKEDRARADAQRKAREQAAAIESARQAEAAQLEEMARLAQRRRMEQEAEHAAYSGGGLDFS